MVCINTPLRESCDVIAGVYRLETEGRKMVLAAHADPNAPQVEYIGRNLPPDELAGLYTATNVLVHPFRGEGL